MNDFLKIGHRGAKGYEPENTIRSFERALELGLNAIECDVRATKEGALVVFHDALLDRMFPGVPARLRDITLQDVQALQMPGGGKIPTFREVCEQFGKRAELHIELKETGIQNAALDIIRHYGLADRVVVSAFARDENGPGDSSTWQDLFWMKSYEPNLKIALLSDAGEWAWHSIAAATHNGMFPVYALNFSGKVISCDLIAGAHEAGCKAFVWTVNEKKVAAVMREWQADGVFTDYPDAW